MNLWKKHVFQCSLFMIFGTCFFIRLSLYHWRTSWFHSSAANYLLPLEPHQIVQNCTNWNLWLTGIIPMCNFYNHSLFHSSAYFAQLFSPFQLLIPVLYFLRLQFDAVQDLPLVCVNSWLLELVGNFSPPANYKQRTREYRWTQLGLGAVNCQCFSAYGLQYKGKYIGAILLNAQHQCHYDHAIRRPRKSRVGLGRASAGTKRMRQANYNLNWRNRNKAKLWRN